MKKIEVLLSKGYFQGVETVFQRLSKPNYFDDIKDIINKVRSEHFPNAKTYKWMPNIEKFNGHQVVKIIISIDKEKINYNEVIIKSFRGIVSFKKNFNDQMKVQLEKITKL